ncbi:hypothetical protein ACWKWP_12950 [Agromyces soli]
MLGLGWQGLGFWGFFWVAFLAMAVFFALSLLAARALGARAIPTFFAFAPLMLGASAALSARATIVVQALILGATLFAWWWAPRAARLRWPVALVVVAAAGFGFSFVGNWVHLSFMLWAAVLAAVWAIIWWCTDRMPRGRRVLLVLAGTAGLFAGCVLSPYGIPLTMERSRAVAEACTGLIIEWTSVLGAAQLGDVRWIIVGLVGLAGAAGVTWWAVVLVRRRGRFDRVVRLGVPIAIVAVPVMVIGIGAVRFLVAGMLMLAPVAAAAVTAGVDAVHRRQLDGRGWIGRPKAVEYASGKFWAVVLSGLAVLALPISAAFAGLGGRPLEMGAVENLPADCRLMAEQGVGDVVVLARPDVPVWIDGRGDFYGREHLLTSRSFMTGVRPLPVDVDCALLPTRGLIVPPLAQEIARSPDWVAVLTQDGYSLWVRRLARNHVVPFRGAGVR